MAAAKPRRAVLRKAAGRRHPPGRASGQGDSATRASHRAGCQLADGRPPVVPRPGVRPGTDRPHDRPCGRYAGRRISGPCELAIFGAAATTQGSGPALARQGDRDHGSRSCGSALRAEPRRRSGSTGSRCARRRTASPTGGVCCRPAWTWSAAGKAQGGPMSAQQIAAALGDGVARQHRLALVATEVGEPLPELPELAALWSHPLGAIGETGDDAVVGWPGRGRGPALRLPHQPARAARRCDERADPALPGRPERRAWTCCPRRPRRCPRFRHR